MKAKPITVAMEDATNDIINAINDTVKRNGLDYFHLEIIINDIHRALTQQVMLQKQQNRESYLKELESQKKGKSEKK